MENKNLKTGTVIKVDFRRAAPPTALPEDMDAMLIGQARERVSAVFEGRELLSFLDDANYELRIFDLNDAETSDADYKTLAGCDALSRMLVFDKSASSDVIAAMLPHEAFHALQLEQVPKVMNFRACLLDGSPTSKINFDVDEVISVLHPDDVLYATNLMEMSAFAMQTHIVHKMDDAGDSAIRKGLVAPEIKALSACYEAVAAAESICRLQFLEQEIVKISEQDITKKYGREAVATAVVAHGWFWDMGQKRDNSNRLFYGLPQLAALSNNVTHKAAPYFSMCDEGYDFAFKRLDRREVELLGTGCGQSMFSLTEFADVTGADYRTPMTEQNRTELVKINRTLGLS